MPRQSFPLRTASGRTIGLIFTIGLMALSAACTGGPAAEQLDAINDQSADLGAPVDGLADATPEQKRCIDEAAVEQGVDLETLIVSSGTEGIAERARLTNITIDCIPDIGSLPSYVEQFVVTFRAGIGGANADLDDEEGACILNYILDNADDPGSTMMGSTTSDIEAIFSGGSAACFDDTTQAFLSGAEGSGPQAYGDDADFDFLYDACQNGDGRGCDLLFSVSSAGSEYNDLAVDCAGRGDGESYCTDGLIIADDGFITDDSPGFVTLRADCATGDMVACDMLFTFAPLDSEFEQFGFTCGGKISVGAVPNCRTRFAAEG